MAPKGNNVIPNAHFRKHWQERVKTWFDQPMRKRRRRAARLEKARAVAPRPVKGLLRPLVHCPTLRYNTKLRTGRGFSLEELKGAGIGKKLAPTIGIAVDHRRTNKSRESLQMNIERLKEYRARLILFPKKMSRPRAGDSTADECKLAAQLNGVIMPQPAEPAVEPPRAITADEHKLEAYRTLRRARVDAKLKGYREEKARRAAEEAVGGAKK